MSLKPRREALEQKRALLQRIKDFDLQIKKNQQDIGDVSEKINSLSKDLDDLVSLYEIVSEQMNPFVGLSKVTKKRLESFEAIHRELNDIKEKISIIEGTGVVDFSKMEESRKDLEFKPLETEIEQPEGDSQTGEESINVKEEIEPEINAEQQEVISQTAEEPNDIKEEIEPEIDTIEEEEITIPEAEYIPETGQMEPSTEIDTVYDFGLTDDEINEIIEMSFSQIPSEFADNLPYTAILYLGAT